MQTFLEQIANTYFNRHREELGRYTFVFPNKRSGLFFKNYMDHRFKGTSGLRPPQYVTVNELVEELSGLTVPSPLRQLFMVYQAYCRHTDVPQTFDRFRFWGEMLLNDFNDVDRQMADAAQLFRNVKGYKEIQSTYLTPEQREIIKHYWHTDTEGVHSDTVYSVDTVDSEDDEPFWAHIDHGDKHEAQTRFKALWAMMLPIYDDLRSVMAARGEGYQGMVFRTAAERLRTRRATLEACGERMFVFVGFGLLSASELCILSAINAAGRADFYWDYDPELMDPTTGNAAGMFVSRYVKRFPSLYKLNRRDSRPPVHHVHIVGIPSTVGQAKYAGHLACGLKSGSVAMVLPDVEMLFPVLSSVPPSADVNVTMGYPLRNSTIASMFERVVSMQLRVTHSGTRGYEFFRDDVMDILAHPMVKHRFAAEAEALLTFMGAHRYFNLPVKCMDGPEAEPFAALKPIFTAVNLADAYDVSQYLHSFLSFCDGSNPDKADLTLAEGIKERIDELERLMIETGVPMNGLTLLRMVERTIFRSSLPLNGRSLMGLQVMGVLETRALSFRNVIMLSMTDRVYPGRNISRSFIPEMLRYAYGLTTSRHRECAMAYNLYRMVSNAEHMWLLFDSRTGGLRSGEMSRYLYQLRFLEFKGVHTDFTQLDYDINPPYSVALPTDQEHTLGVAKTPERMARLNRFRDPAKLDDFRLSASAINKYINCPLSFYMEFVAGVKVPDELKQYLDDATLGTVVHAVAEDAYKLLRGSAPYVTITAEDIARLTSSDDPTIDDLVRRNLNRFFLKLPREKWDSPLDSEIRADALVLSHFVRATLRAEHTPFTFIDGEYKRTFHWEELGINFTMSIDRLDLLPGNVVRLVDYKTGGDDTSTTSMDSLFLTAGEHKAKAIFQLMLYCAAYHGLEHPAHPVHADLQPMIYKLRSSATDGFSAMSIGGKKVQSYLELETDFRERLKALVEEIFNPAVPFYRTPVEENCGYCKFYNFCHQH